MTLSSCVMFVFFLCGVFYLGLFLNILKYPKTVLYNKTQWRDESLPHPHDGQTSVCQFHVKTVILFWRLTFSWRKNNNVR